MKQVGIKLPEVSDDVWHHTQNVKEQNRKRNRDKIYRPTVVPTLFHGCETWVYKKIENKIQRSEINFLRTKGCTRQDQIRKDTRRELQYTRL